jgi:hypothetical protein
MEDVANNKMAIGSFAILFTAAKNLFSFVYANWFPPCFTRAAITCSSVYPLTLKPLADTIKVDCWGLKKLIFIDESDLTK